MDSMLRSSSPWALAANTCLAADSTTGIRVSMARRDAARRALTPFSSKG